VVVLQGRLLKDARLVAALLVIVGFFLGLLQALRVVQLGGLMEWLTVFTFSGIVALYWMRKRRQGATRRNQFEA
jgi:hypothetical protein